MSLASSYIKTRIDDETKIKAKETFASMGLTMSDAIRIFVKRVVADGSLPFEVKSPNTKTIKSFNEYKTGRSKKFDTIEALMKDLNA